MSRFFCFCFSSSFESAIVGSEFEEWEAACGPVDSQDRLLTPQAAFCFLCIRSISLIIFSIFISSSFSHFGCSFLFPFFFIFSYLTPIKIFRQSIILPLKKRFKPMYNTRIKELNEARFFFNYAIFKLYRRTNCCSRRPRACP